MMDFFCLHHIRICCFRQAAEYVWRLFIDLLIIACGFVIIALTKPEQLKIKSSEDGKGKML